MVFEWPLAGLLVAAVLYALGRRGRDSRRRDVCFYTGLLVIVAAIDSPVDRYADRLFWAHMVQHVLLTMVAPPLILLGRPWPRSVRALPLSARRAIARGLHACRALAAPLVAFVLFNAVLLAWHLPALFDLTLRNEAVHDLEHALFFTTALLFWAHLTPTSRRPRLSAAQRVAYGVGAILVSWVLAVVLGFASHPLYGHYAALAHRPGGLTALADQQLAAGIMWVPASIPYTIAVLVAAYDLLEPSKKAVVRDLRPRET
jgi:cytochrome c oxidase assembly factor CtaG